MVYLEIDSRELVPCSQICVVAYEVPPYTDGCLCLREGDGSSEVGVLLLVEILMIPRVMLGMIVAQEEVGIERVIESVHVYADGIAEDWHVDIGRGIEHEVLRHLSCETVVGRGIIVEDRAKCLGELSANIRALLVILLVKELIYADIVCDIRLEACGHILVKAFE